MPQPRRPEIPELRAIVRPPGDSFARALSLHPDRHTIDVHLARTQHARYCETLVSLGIDVICLEPDNRLPDSCFTQDVAIVVGERALLTRPAAPSRQDEPAGMRGPLGSLIPSVSSMTPPATLEGGDVLHFESRLVVGRSLRTNPAGIAALREFARPLGYEVIEAAVPPGILHLSTDVTVLTNGVLVGAREALSQPAFTRMDHIEVPEAERAGCNVLSIGDQVILGGQYPQLRSRLEAYGQTVHALDLSEFTKADGGPTCLSLLVPQRAGERDG